MFGGEVYGGRKLAKRAISNPSQNGKSSHFFFVMLHGGQDWHFDKRQTLCDNIWQFSNTSCNNISQVTVTRIKYVTLSHVGQY